jgi:ribosomal-protein-alanine N-acetyltransferase
VILRPAGDAERAAIAGWRYPPPYETYDHTGPLEGDYRAALESDELVGFVCFGEPARVPGVEATEGVVDVGWGLRPDLMGQGLGRKLIGAALAVHPGARHRIAVLAWNERARRAPARCGFAETGTTGAFVVMERPAMQAGRT